MSPGRLVLIKSTFKNEDGREKSKIGTGYFVTPNLVLTASHVLPAIKDFRIQVRVQETGEWIEADKDPIWEKPSLDAALVVTRKRIETVGWKETKWQQTKFSDNVGWNSCGYPIGAIVEKNEVKHFTSKTLKGELGFLGGDGQLDTKTLDLTVEAPPDDPIKWQGISGAPVFVNDALAGIITKVPENFSTRLEGTPVFELFKDADFIATISKEYILSKNEKWALILTAENTIEEELTKHAGAAILEYYNPAIGDEDAADDEAERNVADIPEKDDDDVAGDKGVADIVSINITTILRSPSSLLNFVELACKAPIMIIDATDFQPGIMLLMGIRGVVRRGVTITLTTRRISESDLSKIPFNIQEIKLISLDEGSYETENMSSTERINGAIKEGIAQLEINPGYLDLPAFDAVRNPIVANFPESKYAIKALEQKTLFLCPFNENYKPKFKFLRNELAPLVGQARKPVRMLDINLPQLVGQSLYEHIRWAGQCVIDWTEWLPNVFYELGVRLAASDKGPVNLIESKEIEIVTTGDAGENSINEQKRLLLALFDPFKYTYVVEKEENTNKDVVIKKEFPSQKVREYLSLIKDANSFGSQNINDSKIFHNHIHDIATKHFDFKQQKLEVLPHQKIRAKIEREVGGDRQKSGRNTILFSKKNKEFRKAFENNIQENWLCAWFYLLHRYTWNEFKTDKKKRGDLIALGEEVAEALVTEPYTSFKDRILKIIKRVKKIDGPLSN